MVELSFFIGKGGVGKTTLASAFALHSAAKKSKRPVLLISTDPAHSLADIFQTRFGDSARTISFGKKRLWVRQVNAQREFGGFLKKYREAIFSIIESGTIFTRKEIEPLLDSTLPGMAEMAALLAIHDAIDGGKYGAIVVDTAPFGHTLRLFEMPQHFSRFLDFLDVAASRDQVLAQTFGGTRSVSQPFIAEWRRIVERVQSALAAASSRLVVVTTPESFALNESVRVRDQLAESARLRVSDVVLNRAIRVAAGCKRCGATAQNTRSAISFVKKLFPATTFKMAEDSGAPILGAAALLRFARHVFAAAKAPPAAAPKRRPLDMKLKRTGWPALQTPLSFSIGKGGVGKTTVSAALAVHQRSVDRNHPVAICSTDPAPSLDDVFQAAVGDRAEPVLGDPKLLASELDSVAEYRRWADSVQQKIAQAMSSNVKGIHVDLSFDRQVISALLEIVPPGVDELFAVFRILDLLQVPGQKVIIDMAPTGHALELLRMPERILHWSRLLLKSLAAHRTLPLARDVAVEIATISQRVRELAKVLRDRGQSRVCPVMLAEPLPDRETARLLDAMHELGANPTAIFVNRAIFAEDAGKCRRCTLAREWQLQTFSAIARRAKSGHQKLFVIRNRSHEISGKAALKEFTQELWQLA